MTLSCIDGTVLSYFAYFIQNFMHEQKLELIILNIYGNNGIRKFPLKFTHKKVELKLPHRNLVFTP